jgi:hypothetical protein
MFGALRVTRSKFRTQDPKMLGVTVQNIVALTICGPEFVHLPTSVLQTYVWENSPVSCFRMCNAVRYEVYVQQGK